MMSDQMQGHGCAEGYECEHAMNVCCIRTAQGVDARWTWDEETHVH